MLQNLSVQQGRCIPLYFGITDLAIPFYLGQVVHPVYDVTNRLGVGRSAEVNVNLFTTGYVTAFTVPPKKRWLIRRYWRLVATGGTALFITRSGGAPVRYAPVQTAQEAFDMCLYLDPGDVMALMATNNAADTTISVCIHYEEGEA